MKFLCFLENLLSRKHIKRSMYITQEYYGTELFCHLRCTRDVSSGFNCKLLKWLYIHYQDIYLVTSKMLYDISLFWVNNTLPTTKSTITDKGKA